MAFDPSLISKNTQFNLPPPPPSNTSAKGEPMGAGILERGEERAQQEQSHLHIGKPVTAGPTNNIENDPAYYGGITTESTNKLLENKPVGSWLVRFSKNANQIIVSLKTAEGKYETVKNINIGGLEHNISKLPMEIIKRHFGENLIVLPKPSVVQQAPTHSVLPPLSPASGPKLINNPANFGSLSRDEAIGLLNKSTIPDGTWLIRTSKDQVVVTVKVNKDKFDHFATINVGGQPKKISDASIEEVKNFFKSAMLLPSNKLEGDETRGISDSPNPRESHGVFPPRVSQELNPGNANISRDPALNTRKNIEQLNDKPIGAWIVYNENGNICVTQKTAENEYKNLSQIGNKPLNGCTIGEVRESFGENLLVYPHGDILPQMSFKPNLCVKFEKAEDFQNLMKEWKNSSISKDFKIAFDEKTLSVFLPYTSHEMKGLVTKNPFLKSYFGGSQKSVFDNWSSVIPLKYYKVGVHQDLPSLMTKADEFFSKLQPIDFDLNISPSASPKDMMNQILTQKNFSGVLIGENHHEYFPKKILIENMQQLKSQGVDTFFLEHLQYDIIQPDLDEYMKSPDDKMPDILEAYLDRLDTGQLLNIDHPYGFKALVKAAKKNNLRVVGIDTEASYLAGYSTRSGSEGSDRIRGLNYQAQEIMHQEGGGKKFVALVGNAHVSTSYKVPGLSEILGVPNIAFNAGSESKVEKNVRTFLPQDEKEGINGGHLHVLITHTEK